MRPLIDWSILAEAMEFYAGQGFKPVEVPWIVPVSAIRVTHQGPIFSFDSSAEKLVPVGSAEQGFIAIAPTLAPGKYLSCSPCFRNENEDRLHQQSFMKVELYQTDEICDKSLEKLIEISLTFFNKRIPCHRLETTEGFDIVTDMNIELGSYGRRQHAGITWLYGTGVALPRLTVSGVIEDERSRKKGRT